MTILYTLISLGYLTINLNISSLCASMENTYFNQTHSNLDQSSISQGKRLLEWNKEKLTSCSDLSVDDIKELFAPEFVVMANGRKYHANYQSYYEFLNKFRADIDSIDYEVQEYVSTDSTVVMPLKAAVKRLNGTLDFFAAIMLIKFDNFGKIIHWQEVYSIQNNIGSPVINDICNLNLIYNDTYQYSLPQKILESFLSGKAFDNPDVYTVEESEKLRSDIKDLYQRIFSGNPVKENLAVITAGAPGAGKTIKLKQDLEANASNGRFYAYVCPDDVCLKTQTRTHGADIANSDKSLTARQQAYDKWRPGSNAAAHLILGNLIRDKYAFYFGSTSSGPSTYIFFDYLKKQGYSIRLIHISAPDDVRWGSIQERDKTFVQTTEQDVKEKGLLLPQRITDTFLKYADEIEFYYRSEVKQDALLAARWIKNEDTGEFAGTLRILNQEAYEQIKSIHNTAAEILKRPELYWEDTVEARSEIKNNETR